MNKTSLLLLLLMFLNYQAIAQSGENVTALKTNSCKGNLIIQTIPSSVCVEIPRMKIIGDKFQDSLILEEIHCGEYELAFGESDNMYRFKVNVVANKTLLVVVYVDKKRYLTREIDYVSHLPDEPVQYDDKNVYVIVEEMPQFPGGDLALQKWIARSVIYPSEAYKLGITGRVFIGFVVDEQGCIRDVKSMRSKYPLLEKEGVRVIRNMPRWKPGRLKGKLVKVSYTVPINFDLQ